MALVMMMMMMMLNNGFVGVVCGSKVPYNLLLLVVCSSANQNSKLEHSYNSTHMSKTKKYEQCLS